MEKEIVKEVNVVLNVFNRESAIDNSIYYMDFIDVNELEEENDELYVKINGMNKMLEDIDSNEVVDSRTLSETKTIIGFLDGFKIGLVDDEFVKNDIDFGMGIKVEAVLNITNPDYGYLTSDSVILGLNAYVEEMEANDVTVRYVTKINGWKMIGVKNVKELDE